MKLCTVSLHLKKNKKNLNNPVVFSKLKNGMSSSIHKYIYNNYNS